MIQNVIIMHVEGTGRSTGEKGDWKLFMGLYFLRTGDISAMMAGYIGLTSYEVAAVKRDLKVEL